MAALKVTEETLPDLNKWERAILGVKCMGRTGLTVQAICALTGASQSRTWASIQKSEYAYPQFCTTVCAPVWSMYFQEYLYNIAGKTNGIVVRNQKDQSGVNLRPSENSSYQYLFRMTEMLMEKYPADEGWVTVEQFAGMKELYRVESKAQSWLRDVIENKIVPWGTYNTYKFPA